MLLLTDSAKSALESILHDSDAPASSGLRLAPSSVDANALALAVADGPADGDVVVDEEVRLYLAPVAADALDDKVLDSETSPTGAVQFKILVQA